LIGCARIIATYPVFSPTFDEPAHVEAGLEWWDHGTYSLEPHHPPLARIFVGFGPHVAGMRSLPINRLPHRDPDVAYVNDISQANLGLARAGVLPFFILAAICVWLLARYFFDELHAAIAVALFTSVPSILAHSGLATTDVALTATFLAVVYAFIRWLDSPDWGSALVFGAALGLAIASKASSLLFFGVSITPILTSRRISRERGFEVRNGRQYWSTVVLAAFACVLVVWSCYRFSVGTFSGIPVLMPELFLGLRDVARHNASGHISYLMGDTGTSGWWYFFPIVLAVKTPLAFLALALAGIASIIRNAVRSGDWRPMVPVLLAAAILVIVLPVRINLGVRHVLPIYAFVSIAAAHAILRAIRMRTRIARAAVVVLCVWFSADSVRAHPDYLAYFNEIAANEPGRVLVDSDLDWGQDLLRLRDTVNARHIDSLSLAYWGIVNPSDYGLSGARNIDTHNPAPDPTGWFAISETLLRLDRVVPGGRSERTVPGKYAWMRSRTPVALVGKSIKLYYLPSSRTNAYMQLPVAGSLHSK